MNKKTADAEHKSESAELKIIDKFRFVPFDKQNESRVYEILPDGYFDLSFLFSESGCRVCIAGPCTEKRSLPLGRYELLIVSFRAGTMPRFADIKPYELVNRVIELPRIFGMDAGILCEELMTRKNQRLRQDFIMALLRRADPPPMMTDRIYNHATSIIAAHGGKIQVGMVSRLLGVSSRTLERKFKDTLGFPPKMFIRLVRFQRVIENLRNNPAPLRLTDIAYDCGYADQAHFIHDFKALAGVLPGSF